MTLGGDRLISFVAVVVCAFELKNYEDTTGSCTKTKGMLSDLQ